MTIKVALEHRTSYAFDRAVTIHPHVVRLRPAPHSRTPIEAYSLRVEPDDHFVNWQQDAFSNYQARLVFPTPATSLTITVDLVADLTAVNPFDFFVEESAEEVGFTYSDALRADLEPYLREADPAGRHAERSTDSTLLEDWVAAHRSAPGTRIIDHLVAVNRAVRDDIGYTVRLEAGVQSPEYTLSSAIGSCRDSAWLLVAILRRMGLAARFVSGYLVQLTSDIPAVDGPSGPAADFTDLHAWTEVYLPGAGWVGMDPTSGLFAGEGHIPLAATPAPGGAAPITGATGPCHATMDFSNTVTRFHEDPRVTLPYTDDQWERVVDLGAHVDSLMDTYDVQLTMGGEPTFVSVDDQTSPEWTTAADGPHKRRRASVLAEKLREVYAPQGLVQRSQGKWYPGEPLPRWQIALMWRTDGEPLWTRPELLADPWCDDDATTRSMSATRSAPTAETAGRALAFAEAVAEALSVPRTAVQQAFEDPLVAVAEVLRKPVGVPVDDADDPQAGDDARAEDLGPDADSPERRAALLEALDAPIVDATAQVLPIGRTEDDAAWQSIPWVTRRSRLVLTAGTSPAGLRLPLDSLSWTAPPAVFDTDPTAPAPALRAPGPPAAPVVAQSAETAPASAPDRPRHLPRTAVVVEVRDGVLYAFLPPTQALEHFVDLVSAVEAAAVATGDTVVVEGYGPPADSRLQSLSVTPDPGVIEVNVQPTGSFAEQSELLQELYAQARLARLGTESFDLDGGHGGTGGGNHITLGGVTPAHSPLLRRPDLLVSMISYWQRHPSLSYLFSGRFVGTTSQAPRADEGREDALYELEIAFAEIDRLSQGGTTPPWMVDRALRHLLTDITGNTHRAEFCIDKLYSPDSARGRLGLLELRAFEMPPHHRMAMVQSLLVRCLVIWFWRQPFRGRLIRHGAELHGRHLLPHHVIADIAAVAADLREAGLDFDTAWLDPFTEFRFPRLGTVAIRGHEIELRGAIEPWNTLGEESTGSGTARYVDSSVERVQVRVTGSDDDRFVLTCNGIPVPLAATERPGERVAGVRFRAWQPPSALHPSITIDSPLVFDLVDTVSGRSVGGATYHVVHPGGRAYERPPVNAVEAESRRNGRFESIGHTPGPVDVAAVREMRARLAVDVGVPGILDLRRARTVLR
ncbi:transglutaminase family protein [Williamsia sp. SKLECPSW1]